MIAPWFLALWLSEPDAGPLFRTSVAVTELLPHVSEAAEILEQRSNKDDQNAAPMHRLAQNLLSMLVVARQDSLHRLSSSSFHVHAAKLFWRVNLHSPRCLTSFEEDVLDQDDEFDEDSSASDEPLDLTDEFDLARSRRIYASLRRHHRQIDAKSFCSPIHPRDLRDDDTVFQYFFDVEKWQQLAETDFASASPDFLWSVPVSVLIARKAKQPNVNKILARLQPTTRKTKALLPAVPLLQSLFPTTEENVCALIYANSGRDLDKAVKTLSRMTGQLPLKSTSSSSASSTSLSSSPSSAPFYSIDLRLRAIDLWNALNRYHGYGAMRVAGDQSIRNVFPALHSVCYLFVMNLFDHYALLDYDDFDNPANHPLPRETALSDVVVFLQILIGSLQEGRRIGPGRGLSPDLLVPYTLNACVSLYTLLLHHHTRLPWIRNTSDIVDADMKLALETDRALRAEQDANFIAAMETDRRAAASERKREEADAIAQQKEREAVQARERQRSEWKEELKEKEKRVAEKTAAAATKAKDRAGGNVIALRVRFPSGKAKTIQLLGETTLSIVFDFVDVGLRLEEATAFQLVRTHPRGNFRRDEDGAKTLDALGLSRATLLVKEE